MGPGDEWGDWSIVLNCLLFSNLYPWALRGENGWLDWIRTGDLYHVKVAL